MSPRDDELPADATTDDGFDHRGLHWLRRGVWLLFGAVAIAAVVVVIVMGAGAFA